MTNAQSPTEPIAPSAPPATQPDYVQPQPDYVKTQPDYVQPQPGYVQAQQPQPGYVQAQQPQPGYVQAQQPQPGYVQAQPGYVQAQQPQPQPQPVYVQSQPQSPSQQQTVVIQQTTHQHMPDPCYRCCCTPCAWCTVEGCSPMTTCCWFACFFWPINGFVGCAIQPDPANNRDRIKGSTNTNTIIAQNSHR
eukprot:TRINITY_DN91_c0_g1_i5.p1 TRINITY_DN91_c0_g1~~TRINITY_DN91_c0_g1_i5.p1  ORF type:complete len:191 (+),score=32.50 TRINITY_DN91_c0_g1_i5:53-625(+)